MYQFPYLSYFHDTTERVLDAYIIIQRHHIVTHLLFLQIFSICVSSWLFGRLCWAVFCNYTNYIIGDSMQCKIVHENTHAIILFTVTVYFQLCNIIIHHYVLYICPNDLWDNLDASPVC